ncbi:MAG: hypothetical protein AAF845_03960 [Bacteroidota bacterium]
MKIPVFFGLVLAHAASLQAYAQSAPLTLPRVGDVIDSEERRYFGLFPDLDPEASLRLEPHGSDSVRVAVLTGEALRPARVHFSTSEAATLADFLDRYEDLFLEPDSTFDAFRISHLVRWRQPYQDGTRGVSLTLRSGDEVHGLILHADTSGLAYTPTVPPFRSFRRADDVAWVRTEDVLRIRRDGVWSRLDLRPNGDPERYKRETLPVLQRQMVFVRGLSPELSAWRRAQPTSGTAEPSGEARNYSRLPLTRWRVAFQYGTGSLDAGSTVTHLFGGGGSVTNQWEVGVDNLHGRLDYALTRSLGVGVAVEQTRTAEDSGSGLDSRRFSATAADVFLSYTILPPQFSVPMLPSVTLWGGGSIAWLNAETTLGYYWPRRDYTASADFAETSVEPGFAAGIEVAFRLSRRTSVVAGYHGAVYPWAQEVSRELDDPVVDLTIKTVEARDFSLRRQGATVGVAVHLGGP